jgi:hypothetical protein
VGTMGRARAKWGRGEYESMRAQRTERGQREDTESRAIVHTTHGC